MAGVAPVETQRPPNPLTQELRDMSARFRSAIQASPTDREIDNLKKAPGIQTAVMNEIVAGQQTNDYRRTWDGIQWLDRLGIKLPDKQFQQELLPALAKECEEAMDAEGIPYRPREKMGMSRRRVVQVGGATVGVSLAGIVGITSYGKHPAAGPRQVSVPATLTAEAPPPSPTPTPEVKEEEINNFNDLLKPVFDDAQKKREARAKAEPDYYHVVDKELNESLINIGVVGFSADYGESLTVLSYNKKTGTITSVSCTRETLTPEVTRFYEQKDPSLKNSGRNNIDTNLFLYHDGGFNLMRKVIEDETGLSADFQVYLDNKFLHDFIQNVLGDSVEIDVKQDLNLYTPNSISKSGKTETYTVKAGRQKMTADEVMRYILSPETEFRPGKGNSIPGRKNDIILAVFNRVLGQLTQDPVNTLMAVKDFVDAKSKTDQVAYDFNLVGLMLAMVPGAVWAKLRGRELKPPAVSKDDLMINDTDFGDGGLIRLHKLIDGEKLQPSAQYYKSAHPNVRKEVDRTLIVTRELLAKGINLDDENKGLAARGVWPLWLQVPINGDPEAEDLVTGYWPATRQLTKQRLFVR